MALIMSKENGTIHLAVKDVSIPRSRQGDIHLLPNTPSTITQEELSYIQKNYPNYKIVVLNSQPFSATSVPAEGTTKVEGDKDIQPNFIVEIISKGTKQIIKAIDEKRVLMETPEFTQFLTQLLEAEDSGKHNPYSPRNSVVLKIKEELKRLEG